MFHLLEVYRYCLLICLLLIQGSAAASDDGKHLFILSGQSNMAGLKPAESFTPTVVKAFGKDRVIVVHDAHGGQPIRRWDQQWKSTADNQPKTKPGDLYLRLMGKVKQAVGEQSLTSVTFLWMQGERDARERNGDVYSASLQRLITQVTREMKQDSINVVIGRLSDFDLQNKRYPHWTKIREVQVSYANSNPKVEWVDTDDLNDGLNRRGKKITNDLHYSAKGYITFGTRLAEKAIHLIQSSTKPGKPDGPAPSFPVSVFGNQVRQNERTNSGDLNQAQPDRKIEFKKVGNVTLNLHFFEPEGHQSSDQRPAVVFFFGGGWVSGTPKQFYKQSRYLAKRGMVAICAEYRVRSKHKTTPQECVKDGKSALRYVRANAKTLGIDPRRIAAGGGSAGGHVAAATATIKDFDEPTDPLDINPRPNALILFNPVFDNSESGYGFDRVKSYWKQISPLHNLSKSTPPTIVFLGTRDNLIPVATGKSFQSKMRELGCRSELHLYEGKPHGFFNSGESFLDTVEKMDAFLVSLKYLEGMPSIRKLLPGGPEKKKSGKRQKKN